MPPDFPAQDLQTGVRERINVSFQKQIFGRFVADASYFLNIGYNLPYSKVLNLMDPQIGYTHKTALSRTVPNPFYQYLTPELFPGQLRSRASVSVGSLLNPYPHYGSLAQTLTPGVNNRYQAIQLRLQRPFLNGFSLLWAYNYNREQNYEFFNADDQYADRFTYIDGFLPRHRMNTAGSLRAAVRKRPLLSFGCSPDRKWRLRRLVDERHLQLQLGAVRALRSGRRGRGSSDRQSHTGPLLGYFQVFKGPLPAFTPRTNPWQYPGVTGPRFMNVDATLSKFFPIAEQIRLEFKMEAYNLTNSFMASMPNVNVTSSLFGRSTGQANRGRELQYTLRLHF